jgi:hypothetical protein
MVRFVRAAMTRTLVTPDTILHVTSSGHGAAHPASQLSHCHKNRRHSQVPLPDHRPRTLNGRLTKVEQMSKPFTCRTVLILPRLSSVEGRSFGGPIPSQ